MALTTEWVRPASVEEACSLLEGDRVHVRPVAGCTGITPRAITGDPDLDVAVDLLGIEELQGIERSSGGLRIGAACSVRELALAADAPGLAACAAGIGDEILQRQATVGGNLAMRGSAPHELATAIVASGGSVEVAEAGGRSTLSADELCDPLLSFGSKLIVAIELQPSSGPWAYRRLATNASSYGVGSVAVHHRQGEASRVVVNPGSGIPSRLEEVERALDAGGSEEELRAAAVRAMAAVETTGDALASARYRRHALAETACEAIEDLRRAGR